MRFLQVATFAFPDHVGGAERVIAEVSGRLAQRGHEVTLLVSDASGRPAREERDGVRVERYAVDRSSPLRFWHSAFRGVRARLRELAGRCDVLHVHQVLSALAAVSPGSAARPLPTVFSFYAPYHQEFLARYREGRDEGPVPARSRSASLLLQRADRYVLARADRLLVLSRFSRGQVRALQPDALARTELAPAGVDLQRFRPARDAAERAACARACGLADDATPLLLSVRRLVPRMGLEDLLQAGALLARRRLAFRLAVAGEGPERGRLEQLAGELSLPVAFLGRVEEDALPVLYRAASVFVLPTRSLEGFGMATIEALASGLPVVATDAGATAEVLQGVAGCRIVRAGHPQGLAEALEPLLGVASARADAARTARRHAQQSLGWEGHLAAVERAASLAREVRS